MDLIGLPASLRARSRGRYRRWLIKSAEQQVAARGGTLAVFDYPVHPTGRWGKAWNLPDHAPLVALISPGEDRYLAACREIVELTPQLAQIPTGRPDDGEQPYWINSWIPGLDGAYLYPPR